MNIGNRVKTARKELGLSQEMFGEKLGMSRSMVVNLEMDKLKNTDQIKRYCVAISNMFGINEDWLLTGEGDMKAPMNELDEIANITRELFGNDPDSSKAKLARFVFSLEEDEMEALIKIWEKALEFIGEIEKDR